ncbi:MAG: 30S ribosomal protein S16 [Alphaproteobacteria bacterium 40-19]|jgi:small subunit ribosomal protein S16|nr:MAG: 30S ribosomal protein S16 [Alphaproteobacteria bacterium 40-19]
MFKLRLARHGAKKTPFYWIMAADSRSPRETGKEKLGTYDPLLSQGKMPRLVLKEDRVKYWLSCGAQPTDRVARLLSEAGLLPGYKFQTTPLKSAPGKKALARQKKAS